MTDDEDRPRKPDVLLGHAVEDFLTGLISRDQLQSAWMSWTSWWIAQQEAAEAAA